MTPALQMFAVIIAATLLQTATADNPSDTIFTLTVSSRLRGGEKATLCVQIHSPTESICLNVTLNVNSNVSLLLEEEVEMDIHRCVHFQVPTVLRKTVATVALAYVGDTSALSKDTKVLIVPPSFIHLVQSDKPIYKPGQTVYFRIVSIDEDFVPVNRVYTEVVLQDPKSNRIAQWLDKSIAGGILDLSFEMIPEAVQGTYRIIAKTDKNEQIFHSFTVKEYVLPKYEVTVQMPSGISLLDREITMKICGKYTYGKPVAGSVKAVFCRKVWWYYSLRISNNGDLCNTYYLTTDKDGCATQAVNMTEFFPRTNSWYYQNYFEMNAEIVENGTGVTLYGSGKAMLSFIIRRVTFVDAPKTYRPGLPFQGKVKVTGPDNKPVSNAVLYLSSDNEQRVTLTTDSRGLSAFTLDTDLWEDSVSLRAWPKKLNTTLFVSITHSPRYHSAYLTVTEFYSRSHSFVKLMQVNGDISCGQSATVRAQYIIQGEELKKGQDVLDFFFLVTSRGEFRQHGHIRQFLNEEAVKKGELEFKLRKGKYLAPYAQVVVYTVLPNEETVADSMDFPVQPCLLNKVSLKFSSVVHLPAEKTILSLKAHPGSLCSVRAIDKSILLLQPEQELTVDYVYSRLPLKRLNGYSYEVKDPDPYPCIFPETTQPPLVNESTSTTFPPFTLHWEWMIQPAYSYIYKPPNWNDDDVYKMFKKIGMKLLTNAHVTKPNLCKWIHVPEVYMPTTTSFPQSLPMATALEAQPAATASDAPMRESAVEGPEVREEVRNFFPETWIWDLITVGGSGSANVEKTVPDTITKWSAGAFCVSSLGLGISPNIGLTAFKPFFVSLTLPYSVIRGEVLTLKATAFNYLSKCIMVEVKLAKSDQFTYRNCDGCQYTECLCAGESKTFSWMVTPTALGQVDLRVSAEALQTKALCGKEVPTVPTKGRTDTVVRKLLVEAEGTPQTESHNALLCPKGKPVEKKFSLVLPEKFVEGSARASVIVLGDLMGGALKNLNNLLRMPYGCGEQNMLNFAPNIFILNYLKSTNQLTKEILSRATRFLQSGYQRELNFKRSDGSYSAFGNRDSSGNTWLTSFVMKSFGGAKKFIFVDDRHIKDAKKWLSSLQRPDGCIRSVGKLFHNAMKGGVSEEVSLTAYITAALLELDTNKDSLVENCLKCLKTALAGKMDNLYTTALMSYTFTLAGDKEMRSKLITQLHQKSILEGVSRHWEKTQKTQPNPYWRRPVSLDVEMTSYVLLALLSGPYLTGFDLGYSAGIARWLIQQQNPYGGFSSTQDTVVALQALAKYSAATYSVESETTVTVKSTGGPNIKFTVDQSNRLLYQQENLSKVPGEYTVKAKGKSCVLVQIAMHYNIPPPPDFSTFFISTKTQAQCNTSIPLITLTVQVRYNGDREETNMVIINIKELSGHNLQKNSLEQLRRSSLVKRVEENDGYINIYLDGLKKNKSQFYTVKLEKDQPVGNLKPAVVKIYDYYQTSDEAVTEYTSPCSES